MQIKSKTPIEGVSHWCDGNNLDGSNCGQIVKNENAQCEAGHPNEIRRSTASPSNKGLQASDAVLSVDDFVGFIATGNGLNHVADDDMPVVEKYVWCCPECGERGDPMDRYADAQDLGEVHIDQRHGSWTKFLDVKGLTEDGKEISFSTSEQPSAEDSKKMLAALDRRTAARAAEALAEFVRTTDSDEIYAWFIEDLAFQEPQAAPTTKHTRPTRIPVTMPSREIQRCA